LARGAAGGVDGQGVRDRRLQKGRRRRHPAPRRHRVHVGARPAPLLQARQVVRVHVRRCDVSSRAGRAADQSVVCPGHEHYEAEVLLTEREGVPALAFWVTAVRELLEESGILLACDEGGRGLDLSAPRVKDGIERCRRSLMAGEAPFAELITREGWYCDLRPLHYLSHFITPTSSPIRFTARFFLSRLPSGQEPRLFTEETSEGFWIFPGEGYRRYLSGEMKMAEPGEYGLGYLAQFSSLDELM